MNSTTHAALRVALDHEALKTIKQLETKLERERMAHKRTQDEYEDLQEAAFENLHRKCFLLKCNGCGTWMTGHESNWPHTTSVVHFNDARVGGVKKRNAYSEMLTWCSECEDYSRESGWNKYCVMWLSTDLNGYIGEDLSAILIQLAWRRFKGEFNDSDDDDH